MKFQALTWLFVIGISISLTGGCASEGSDTDLVVLTHSDSLFADVLLDLHRLDTELFERSVAQNDGIIPSDSVFTDSHKRDSVLSLHGLSVTEFDARVAERLTDPLRFQTIYNLAVDKAVRQ